MTDQQRKMWISRVRKYFAQTSPVFFDSKLLEEIRNLKESKEDEIKSWRIYKKCLRHKKWKLAYEIERKYGWQFPRRSDDLVTASGFALLSVKDPRYHLITNPPGESG